LASPLTSAKVIKLSDILRKKTDKICRYQKLSLTLHSNKEIFDNLGILGMAEWIKPFTPSTLNTQSKMLKTVEIHRCEEGKIISLKPPNNLIINWFYIRSQYWWHNKRPLILKELAVFLTIPFLVTTKADITR
jgi:hypothetical protein